MRKLAAGLFMSLDGVVEKPQDWVGPYASEEVTAAIGAGVGEADTVLIGQQTYLLFEAIWKNQGDNVPISRFLNNSPKHVVSRVAMPLPWQPAERLEGDLVAAVAELKERPGKNIQVPGSPRLVRALLREGLLDELSLSICPVVVGKGFRLFDEIDARVPLELVDSKTYSNGVVGVTYRPTR